MNQDAKEDVKGSKTTGTQFQIKINDEGTSVSPRSIQLLSGLTSVGQQPELRRQSVRKSVHTFKTPIVSTQNEAPNSPLLKRQSLLKKINSPELSQKLPWIKNRRKTVNQQIRLEKILESNTKDSYLCNQVINVAVKTKRLKKLASASEALGQHLESQT